MFTLEDLRAASALVHSRMLPTPQYLWPLLSQASGANVWVKHENHAPTGAFKVRGSITYIDWLRRTQPQIRGICTAYPWQSRPIPGPRGKRRRSERAHIRAARQFGGKECGHARPGGRSGGVWR